MSTAELHIQLTSLLQKVSTHHNQGFLSQEYDMYLNREVSKFIKQRYNINSNVKREGAFDIVKRVQDLNTLLRTKPLQVLEYNQKEDIVILPFDFLVYTSSEISVTPICGKLMTAPVDIVTNKVELPSIKFLNGLTKCIITLTINGQDTVLFTLADLPADYLPQDNIANYKKIFILNNAIHTIILDKLKDNEIEFTYDSSNSIFIFSLIGGTSFNITYNQTVLLTETETVYNSSSTSIKGNQQTTSIDAETRLLDEEFKREILNSSLSGNRDQSIGILLRERFILIPKSKNVVYNSLTLTYICKPRKIDLLLGSNSELPTFILEEVVSNTAQTLKGVISSDTYDKFSQENLLIE